jgi:hypothetical protein
MSRALKVRREWIEKVKLAEECFWYRSHPGKKPPAFTKARRHFSQERAGDLESQCSRGDRLTFPGILLRSAIEVFQDVLNLEPDDRYTNVFLTVVYKT